MGKFTVDGEEVDLQGIEYDSVVIIRPCQKLEGEDWDRFLNSSKHLTGVFARHHCSLIFANYGEVTFEVLHAIEEACHA